jgi:hypothetical protein
LLRVKAPVVVLDTVKVVAVGAGLASTVKVPEYPLGVMPVIVTVCPAMRVWVLAVV